LQQIFEDAEIPLQEKQELLERETKGDASDATAKSKLTIQAKLPLNEEKEKLWKWYLDETAKDSDKSLEASMAGFWNWTQVSLLEPYIDKFFESAIDVCKKRTTIYCKMYFTYLAPGVGNEKILKSYEDLAKRLGPELKLWKTKVEAAIVNQKRLLESYELCKKHYEGKQ